ncbi:MAG: S26 family signal peptidase [Candidatus Thermoplasmatota archaeon]|nr:S26 family signal peptidase [Candidatus Thermoplasmatota archaeon]MED6306069.1 S26 family signal peptidase [Candidatus Thermoplasmatota archaeon]
MTESDEWRLPESVKDVGIAIGSVALVFLLTFAYSGNWPPMVVIESGSMEHDDNPLYPEPGYAHLGVIDTGDLVIVKASDKSDIVTYLEGKKTGYKKYGDYGDVMVYYKNGIREKDGQPVTPVIHRAMAWVEVVDKENKTYYIPEIDTYFNGKIELSEIGLGGGAHIKDLENSGYITKGDSTGNRHPDQMTHFDITGNIVQPVDPDWVVGIARGELPWFGLIKLRVTQPDNYAQAPPECRTMLGFSILAILIGPFSIGKIWEYYINQTIPPPKKRSKS